MQIRQCFRFVAALTVAVLGGSATASAGSERVVYAFKGGSDGSAPYDRLTSLGSFLYGTTRDGGANGVGTVFKLNPKTGAHGVLYSFKNDGNDATAPSTGLINFGNMLYGVTASGGASGYGTVFKVNPSTGGESVVYSFKDGSPQASPLSLGSMLYGTTTNGGAGGFGTVFELNTITDAYRVVYTFKGGSDGANPQGVLLNVNGSLYAATYLGGSHGYGTVFVVNPTTGAETVRYAFKGYPNDGAFPYGRLTNIGGTLYGTTFAGGAGGVGTVFKFNHITGAYNLVHAFGGSDGFNPHATMVNVGGTLYGTTTAGGSSGAGTVFKVDTSTDAFSVVYTFTGGADGGTPYSSLISVGSTLYGTTVSGGAHGFGTVFAVTP